MWWVLAGLALASGFYLPGVTLHTFNESQVLELLVDKLDSARTELPFNYYDLNFCKPNHIQQRHENLGQILQGDRIEPSKYTLRMNVNVTCAQLCQQNNTSEDMERFRWMIDNEYRASWVLDNLPAGLRVVLTAGESGTRLSYYEDGFPIGYKDGEVYYIYNHAHIIVKINQVEMDPEPKWVIVGFLVNPMSVSNCSTRVFKDYYNAIALYPEEVVYKADFIPSPAKVPPAVLDQAMSYSYSVSFEESEVHWTSRWDYYFRSGGSSENEVHWLSIINSFAMVLFLSGMVAHILGRTLRKDISLYNERADSEESEETGWKQVHGDVFRPPLYAGVFAVLVGSGVQLVGMTVLTLFFASLGFLSPAHRGGLVTTVLLLFVFMGVFAGYSSARLYKFFGGEHWKTNTVATAFFLPGCCFSMFFLINLCIWAEQSSGATPFFHLLSLLVLWLGISVPLVFLGSAIGHKKTALTAPCEVSRIPRPLNILQGVARLKTICVMAGSLPFGCMFIELSFVMKSLWHHSLVYYLFGFLFLCFFVLVITSAEVSILMTYILLNREDYRWWWLSFGVAGSSGLYLFGYSVIYFLTELELTRLSSIVLYFGYMLLASGAYALVTGAIGFWATFIFARTIYSLIKVE